MRKTEVRVAKVTQEPVSSKVEFTGNLLPRRMTQPFAEVDGIVKNIPIKGPKIELLIDGKKYSEQLSIALGQEVKEGDILVELDQRDFNDALKMANAKLAKAQADLDKLNAWQRPEEVQRLAALRDEAQARFDQADREEKRLARSMQSGAISPTEYERQATESRTAFAMLESAKANLATAKAGPTKEEIAIQKALVDQADVEVSMRKRDLEKTIIKAPFDGAVTSFNVEVGGRVSPNSGPIAELLDLRYAVAEIGVPEAYIGRINILDLAQVTAAGMNQPVPGIVIAINKKVQPETRTCQVRVGIDNHEGRFRAGQFARVRLELADSQDSSLTVPNQAIILYQGQPHVFVLEKDKVRRVRVEEGVSDEKMTEIKSGLEKELEVVIDNPALLSDGMSVEVIRQETGDGRRESEGSSQ